MSKSRKRTRSDEATEEPPAKKEKPTLRRGWTHTQPDGKYGRLVRRKNVPDDIYFQAHRRRRVKRTKPKAKPKKKGSPKTKVSGKAEEAPISITPQKDSEGLPVLDSLCRRFEGFISVVTGGGRGAGQECAIRLAKEGSIVYILDKKRFRETVDKIEAECKDSEVHGRLVDVTQADAFGAVIKDIIDTHGQIDVVVHCVNVEGNCRGLPAHEVDREDFQETMNINLFGVFNVAQTVIPYMIEKNYGRIVNIVSSSGIEGDAGDLVYASSTAAVICATKCMGKDYADSGITVNAICCGKTTETSEVLEDSPIGRTGEFEELAGLTAYVASEENSYTTGFCFDFTGAAYI